MEVAPPQTATSANNAKGSPFFKCVGFIWALPKWLQLSNGQMWKKVPRTILASLTTTNFKMSVYIRLSFANIDGASLLNVFYFGF